MILVTGATGFIGKRLLKAINEEIRILSRSKHANYVTVVCNFENNIIPSYAMEGIDTVLHLAGFSHDMRNANKIESLYRKVNVDATIRLAQLAVKSGVKKFIFVSSVKAGGNALSGNCMTEVEQCKPQGVYGETKREAELQLLEIGRKSGMHVSIIRPSLVYGPNVKGNLKLMLAGIKRGWFPPLPETNNKRSMIHVDDLVRVILLVAKNNNTNGEIYIATDGNPYSSREIYDTMCNIAGRSPPKWSVPRFVFDVLASISPSIKYKIDKLLEDECYSSEKLEALGFKAKKTLMEMNETSF